MVFSSLHAFPLPIHEMQSSHSKISPGFVLRDSAEKSTPSLSKGGWRHLIGWPALVISAQLILQALGWSFFAAVKYHRQIPLPYTTALWVKNNPHLSTLIATLISTILAGCSTLSLSFYLHRPMTLSTLGASKLEVAGRFVIVFYCNRCSDIRVRNIQFWSTLITPVTVIIPTTLFGTELDLASPVLDDIVSNTTMLRSCLWNDNFYRTGFSGKEDGGYAAAKSYFGFPLTVSVMAQTYNRSTAGILTAPLADVNISMVFFREMVPLVSTLYTSSPLPRGLSTNYSTVQQGIGSPVKGFFFHLIINPGFTVDVHCEFRNLTSKTKPNIKWSADKLTSPNLGDSRSIVLKTLSSDCPAGAGYPHACPVNRVRAYVVPDRTMGGGPLHYALMTACLQEQNYTLLFALGGIYAPIVVGPDDECQKHPKQSDSCQRAAPKEFIECKLAPKMTQVRVDYSSVITTTVLSAESSNALAGNAAIFAVYNLQTMMSHTQGPSGNVVGDHFKQMTSEPGWNNNQTLTMVVTSRRTRAWPEMEHSTLKLRAGHIPLVLHAGSWCQAPLYRHPGDMPSDSQKFDPSNPLRLMSAAAAGGLKNAFTGIENGAIKERGQVSVVLESIPGRGPALVRADDYRALLVDPSSPRSSTTQGLL
ncbi:hypothetical protein C8J57DRAFT_1458932 [Mycena rebaudengoi]|nr:hypothetical protein C8J57DRAFT_1458932 [Mycena rebaudengoi]